MLTGIALLAVWSAVVVEAADSRSLNLNLLDAAKSGEPEVVATRLREGASVKTRDRFGNTALIYAARGAHFEAARILVESDADTNQANVNGDTPLFEAAGSGNLGLVRLLLEYGANPNAVNIKKISPLANAVYYRHADIAELLLERGARPDVVDSTGKDCAVYAAANGETGILGLILDASEEFEIALDKRYAHDLTLLMWAAGYGHVEVVRLLIGRGADTDLRDDRGKAALMIAEENGHAEVVTLLRESIAAAKTRD